MERDVFMSKLMSTFKLGPQHCLVIAHLL